MPLDVKCRSCAGCFHETNDYDGWIDLETSSIPDPRVKRFNPDVVPTAPMFRLKEPYVTWGWDTFPRDESISGEAMECPSCGTPYTDASGKVLTVPQSPAPSKGKKNGKAAKG